MKNPPEMTQWRKSLLFLHNVLETFDQVVQGVEFDVAAQDLVFQLDGERLEPVAQLWIDIGQGPSPQLKYGPPAAGLITRRLF